MRIANWDDIFAPHKQSSNSSATEENTDNVADSEAPLDSDRTVWIELGCGKGENVLALAHRNRDNPSFAVIGAEMHPNGLGNLFSRLQQAKQQKAFWSGYTLYGDLTYDKVHNKPRIEVEHENDTSASTPTPVLNRDEWCSETHADPYRHLRVFPGDCMKLITLHTPDRSVDRILVTFPDPFPKGSDVSCRLFQFDTVREFHRVLKTDEAYLCLATDHEGYFEWAQQIVDQSTCGWERMAESNVDRMEWLPAVSSYEEKGWREGRQTFLSCWKAISTATIAGEGS
jgi:tRNA G46 methylase TrmB